MESRTIFICYCRTARIKARKVAATEAQCLLDDLGATMLPGGPHSEHKGVFWLSVPTENSTEAIQRCTLLGYTDKVEYIQPLTQEEQEQYTHKDQESNHIRFHRDWYCIVPVYKEDQRAKEEHSINARVFWLQSSDRSVHPIQGYRGDGSSLGRRGLPYYDARMLVNLVRNTTHTRFLDPFAGAGGLVIEALACGYTVTSVDSDEKLTYGLQMLGAQHYIGDARSLPFESNIFEGVATEVPFASEATETIVTALAEVQRVLVTGGKLAMMCADYQANALRWKAVTLSLTTHLDAPIDRKGTPVHVFAWQK
jgi:SAM-dependent methyltransferase